MMGRLNTRNLLKKEMLKIEGDNYNCVLCDLNREETAFHLLFSPAPLENDVSSRLVFNGKLEFLFSK